MAATVALLGAVALGACDDPAPVGTVPGSSSTASASVPSTPEPTRPAEEATPASAIAFTRYFWDLYNYAYQTYDTAPLKAVSDPACKFCQSAIDDVASAVKKGARTTGSTVSVIESASPPVKISTGTVVVVTVSQQPGELVLADGSTSKDSGWKRLRTDFSLAWSGGRWSVEGVDARTKSGVRWPG